MGVPDKRLSDTGSEYEGLPEKTVIVTGASQGIGEGIAKAFAVAGCRVVVHYRSNKQAAETVVSDIAGFGGTSIPVAAHLNDNGQVSDLFKAAIDAFGRVDILINNAGSFPNVPLLEMTLQQWKKMYEDNVDTVFLCTQAAAREMKKQGGGSIVNIASISGMNPGADHAHYNSAKAAVIMFTQSAAQELGADNIRVNAISPGLVERPGIAEQWPDGVGRWQRVAPLTRMGTPGDIASACLFLASDSASWITGANLPVEGGVMSAMIY